MNDHIFHRTQRASWPKIEYGQGVYLYDSEGRRYLDACGGVHLVSIGHGVPEIGEARA